MDGRASYRIVSYLAMVVSASKLLLHKANSLNTYICISHRFVDRNISTFLIKKILFDLQESVTRAKKRR